MVEKTPEQSLNETIAKATATEKPLVSVIIPTYNRAGMLSRAIRSIQCQTYPHLEIIVVDDGSTDDAAAVVESLGDQRIRYVRHEINQGVSAARNTGIRLATGEIIGFLDDDVEWKPEKVAHQLKLLDRYDVVLCTRPGAVSSRYRRKERVTLENLRRGRLLTGGPSALIARAATLRDTLFDETLGFAEDWDLFIRLAQKYTVGYLNEPLVRNIEGGHMRISNRIQNWGAREMEAKICHMLWKHENFFGPKWFRRHMCTKLLAAWVRTPREKMTDILYTARRYGAVNVVWWLGKRFLLRRRDALQRLKARFSH